MNKFQRDAMAFEPTAKIDKTRNQINTIYPFKNKYGTWVFNDEAVGLHEEPFVSNINPIIETVVKRDKFTAFISHSTIANEQIILDRVDDNSHGDIGEGWYQMRGTGLIGWLCPATLKYFSSYPKEIHVRIEE